MTFTAFFLTKTHRKINMKNNNLSHGDFVTWDKGRIHGCVVAVNYVVASTLGPYWRVTAQPDDGAQLVTAESSFFEPEE